MYVTHHTVKRQPVLGLWAWDIYGPVMSELQSRVGQCGAAGARVGKAGLTSQRDSGGSLNLLCPVVATVPGWGRLGG